MAKYETPGQYSYEGILLHVPGFPPDLMDRVKSFPLEEGDVCIVTYPKAGTTWASEIIDLIHRVGDVEAAKKIDLKERVKYLELGATGRSKIPELDRLAADDHPRLMRTHLPAKMFKKQLEARRGKFIVVMRNVKDNLVSFYHFYRASVTMGNYTGPWHDFFELFKAKGLFCGDWLEFNLSWWAHRDLDNIMFVNYEDLKKSPHQSIGSIAEFLDKPLTDSQLDKIVQHTTFDNMKTNDSTNMTNWSKFVYNHKVSPFMRKGEVGDWQSYFTPEQNDYVDKFYVREAEAQGMTFDFL